MDEARPIYLDHAASTPMRPEVRDAMAPFLEGTFGNPSSVHSWGRRARAALEDARERIGHVLAAPPGTVRFVGGGTDSISLAVLGRVDRARSRGVEQPLLFRSTTEHSAVRESMAAARSTGCRVEAIYVARDGSLDLPDAQELRSRDVQLVSVQWVNQETGLILPVEETAEICEAAGVPLHVDAVQAVGKIPLDLDRIPLSLLSLSGHKLGGPRGTGLVIVQRDAEISPRLFGGGQERGIRPGTEDVAGAVALARALEISSERLVDEGKRLTRFREHLESELCAALPGIRIHGVEGRRAPHILNLGIPGIARDVLPGALDLAGIGASAGSACRSGATSVSPVLDALYGEDAADVAPLRLSLGWSTTLEEVEEAARRIPSVVERIWNAP